MSIGRIACTFVCLAWPLHAAQIRDKGFTPDDLFQMTHVWKVELTFTPDQWSHLPAHRVSASSGQTLLGAPGLRNGLTGAAGMTFDWVHADLKIDGVPFHDIAVRYKDNGTYRRGISSGKVSFKLDLNKYIKRQKLAKLDKINLASEIADGTYMKEDISYRLFRDAAVPAPRTSYARVYITIAGERSSITAASIHSPKMWISLTLTIDFTRTTARSSSPLCTSVSRIWGKTARTMSRPTLPNST